MPPDYIIFACFAIALYFYINQNNQMRSTASAIRSVFTGECRSTCRQSVASRLSGVSSLQDAGPSDRIGPICICESCPCERIENFLRTCSPITRMYTTITSTLSRLYCSIIASIIGTNNYDSNENFTFKDPNKSEISLKDHKTSENNDDHKLNNINNDRPGPLEEKSTTTSKLSLVRRKSTTFFKGLLSKKKKLEDKSDNDVNDDDDNVNSASPSKSGECPQCVEEGKTCLRECPKAKK